MSSVSVVNKIKTKVSEMGTINNVFDYSKGITDTTKFPLADVTLLEGDGEFLTTAHNLRKNRYSIKVYQEKLSTGQGSSNSERIIREVLDELLTAFDNDTTLSGTVKWVVPLSWNARYTDRELDVRGLEVVVETAEIVTSI